MKLKGMKNMKVQRYELVVGATGVEPVMLPQLFIGVEPNRQLPYSAVLVYTPINNPAVMW